MRIISLLFVLFLACCIPLSAETYISGTISTSQTWTWDGSPYIISGTVLVQGSSNPVVTIQSRVVVKFNSNAEIQIGHGTSSSLRGGMVVNGVTNYPVRFTANSETPTPGFWKHIRTNLNTVDGQLSFNHAIFEYGGSTNGNFEVGGSNPVFNNCIFRNSQKMGLYHAVNTASATVSTTYFQENGTYPLNWNQNFLSQLGTGCSYINNGTQRILIVSQNITTPQTWLNQGIPYEPDNDITVYTGNSPLIMANNTAIAFRSGKRLIVGHQTSDSNRGCIQADGVTFTGLTENPGAWGGILINRFANQDQSFIINSVITYSGSATAAVNISSNAGFTLSGCTISNSQNWGIYAANTSELPMITSCQFISNARSVSLAAADAWRLGSGNTYSGSGDLRPEIRAGNIGITCFLTKQPVAWFINGDITHNGIDAPVLTVEPNSTLDFANGSKFSIGSTSTSSYAAGVVAENCTFRPDWESQYRWLGIEFHQHSAPSSITGCQFRKFGYNNTYGLKINSNSLVSVQGCTFINGLGYAIETGSASQFSITGSTIYYCDKTISVHPNNLSKLGAGNVIYWNTDNRIKCSSGTISQSATWVYQPVPIHVLGDISLVVTGGVTLGIGYGTILEFSSGAQFSIGSPSTNTLRGTLQATGVVFRGESQVGGWWRGIYINSYADQSLISACTIRDAGFSSNAAITVNSPSTTITGSQIQNCSAKGIFFGPNSRATVSGTRIMTCGSHPVSVPANAVSNISESNNFTGNSIDRIEVRAETISLSSTWRNAGIPYQATSGIAVYSSTPYTHLTIEPGTTVMFPNAAGFTIGTTGSPDSRGSLQANEVTFTRSDETSVPMGIKYNNYIVDDRCILTDCVIEYARDTSTSAAVYIINSSPQFAGCTIQNCPGDGIFGTGTNANFSVNDCLFSNLNGYPIKTSATAFASVSGVGNRFVNNNPNRILVVGNNITTDQEWNNPGVPVEITTTFNVSGTSLPVLKINSGLHLLFRSGIGLTIGSTGSPTTRGGIQAMGATFAAMSGNQGDWTGLQINNYSLSDSYIENCTIHHGASNIYINNAIMNRIEGCIIEYGNYGIRLSGVNSVFPITRNFIRNNSIGIHCSGNANPVIGGDLSNANCITGNSTYGLQNTSGLTVNATYNWWGHEDGPTIRLGDAISGNINYAPWRTTIIGDAPSRFHLLLPPHASIVESPQPLLDWEDAIDPTPEDTVSYTLVVSTSPDYEPGTITTYTNLLSSLYQFPAGILGDDTRYWWKVTAFDTQDQYTHCYEQNSYFDLAIPEPPSPFSLVAPTQEGTVQPK